MNLLETQHVVKKYADHVALNGVSITVPEKSIFGLLGPNGAGKTSLIRIITQITAPDEGEVFFKGEKLSPEHIGQIGYLPEERGLYKKMKVGEQLIYLAELKGMKKNEALSKLKEWFIKFEMETWWDKKIEDLSKGMQQKVQFVATVIHEPQLLILDEPFSGFDPVNANLIKDEILDLRKKGTTVIFSTHRMESVEELCDNIALINKSQVVLQGSTREIRKQYKSHTYQAEGLGQLPVSAFPSYFEILSHETTPEGEFSIKIKLPQSVSSNELLSFLIQEAEIHSYKEAVPSMNDIFIMKVSGENTKITTGFTE
jgi:ABC-2 type transport system ATP-binding protein